MPSRKQIGYAACCACLILAAAVFGRMTGRWAAGDRVPDRPDSWLAIAPPDLDLGDVRVPGRIKHEFRIRNVSNREVMVEALAWSCDCAGISPEAPFRINPGGETIFTLVLRIEQETGGRTDDTRRLGFMLRGSAGEYLVANTWELRYRVVSLLRPSHGGAIGAISHKANNFKHVVRLHAAEGVARVVASSGRWIAEIKDTKAAGGREFVATFRSQGVLPLGPFKDSVEMTAFDKDGQALGTEVYVLSGTAVEDVVAEPGALHFGKLVVGEEAEEPLSFRSLSATPFGVEFVSSQGGVVVEKGRSMTGFVVKVVPQRECRFKITEMDGTTYLLPVQIQYHAARKADTMSKEAGR